MSAVSVGSQQIRYVAEDGSDANSGLSWVGAKQTVQAAINSLTDDGMVFVGAGTFTTSATIAFPTDKAVHLVGVGKTASILTYTGSGVAVQVGNGTAYNDWGSIRDLQIKCASNAAVTLLEIDDAHRGWVEGCHLAGESDPAGSRGLHLIDGYQNAVRNCVVASVRTGIDIDSAGNDVSLIDVSVAAATTCLQITNSHNVRVLGGQYSDAVTGVKVDQTAASPATSGVYLLNVHFEGNTLDLHVGKAADTTNQVEGFTAVGCPFPSGATFDECDNPTLVGCVIGNGSAGTLTFTSSCSRPVAVNCGLRGGATLSDSGTDTNVFNGSAGKLVAGMFTAKENATGKGFVYAPATATGSAFRVDVGSETNPRFTIRNDGLLAWGAGGASATDATVGRAAAGVVSVGKLAVTNSAAASSLGTVAKKIEVFDGSGNSLGFLAVYDAIT